MEVGGGLGLVSIAARRAGAAKVVCTDGEEAVVHVAQRNLDLDYAAVEAAVAAASDGGGGGGVGDGSGSGLDPTPTSTPTSTPTPPTSGIAAVLKWGDAAGAVALLQAQGPPSSPDFVLVADCVFGEDDAVWAALGVTLAALCSSPETILVIAQTQRYPAREARFFKNLQVTFKGSSIPATDITPRLATVGDPPPVQLWTLQRRV